MSNETNRRKKDTYICVCVCDNKSIQNLKFPKDKWIHTHTKKEGEREREQDREQTRERERHSNQQLGNCFSISVILQQQKKYF